MNDLVLFGKAFADPTRIRVLALLRVGELCVCEIVDALELSQSTLSTHLQILRQAGLVATRKNAKWIYYRLEPAKKSLLDAVFAASDDALTSDKRLQRDCERIAERLRLRVDGCCVVSVAALNKEGKGGECQCC
jgi:ArsR family transcriptional regulator, arsenate/arsenite/antimonite-responsive transcriptional repressor